MKADLPDFFQFGTVARVDVQRKRRARHWRAFFFALEAC